MEASGSRSYKGLSTAVSGMLMWYHLMLLHLHWSLFLIAME